MADLKSAFASRSVFVTGHTGFIGSWLALWLARLGARVHGYALPPHTDPSNFVASGVRETLASHREADVRDAAALADALDRAAPDAVFHLAAQPLVRESYRRPRETFEVNVVGTCALLDAVRLRARPCVVIVMTSDKCYDNRGNGRPFFECDPLGGSDPYSASKAAEELVVTAYRHSFFPSARLNAHGIALSSVRAGNAVGGGDWSADRLVPDLARALSAGRPLDVRNPAAIRPWQHVLELLDGTLRLASRLLAARDSSFVGPWNFGPWPGDTVTVREIVDRFIRVWGSGAWRNASDPAQPPEAAILRLSIDNAATHLDWRPRWSLDATIERTARWYRSFYRRDRPARDLCIEDIEAYETS
jgi:CDP-glucose 4,6-dehydratase